MQRQQRRIEPGAGTAEASWREWPPLQWLPDMSLDHWLPADSRLVVVAPHPDDEVLACGGLLALHAARGGETLIVAATDGEASHADLPGWNPSLLASARHKESLRGLAALGLRNPSIRRLGFPDGALAAAQAGLTRQLEATLRPGDRVVTTWRWDGHPDHEACALATLEAAQRRDCPVAEAPVWMWHWAQPGDTFVTWHLLHALRLPLAAQIRKANAIAAHHSQLSPRIDAHAIDRGPVLDAAILQRAARGTEHFFLAPGTPR